MSAQRTAALLPPVRGLNRRSRRALRSQLRRFGRRRISGAGSALVTDYHYDAMGRFTSRDDVGTYGYDLLGANPYAVRSVTERPGTTPDTYFCYDPNGNVTWQAGVSECDSSITRAFTWSAGNRLRTATAGTLTSTFHYTASGARFRQAKDDTSVTVDEETLYIGAYYERVTVTDGATTTTKHRLYVRAGERVVAEEEILHTGARETRYWHRDHLGSITAITTQDYNGGEYGEVGTTGFYGLYGFAAWGEPRDAITTVSNPANWITVPPSGVYHRGFTGHEMLPDLGIVHMNGRVYLPEIGRFLSPDPFVQFPESTQNYNRYVYVGNNPLSYTDPSGYFLSIILVAIAQNAGATLIQQAILAMIGGYMESMGNMRQAWQAGGTTLLTAGFTAGFRGAGPAAGGGRFGDGALAPIVSDCGYGGGASRIALEAYARAPWQFIQGEALLAALPFETAAQGGLTLVQFGAHHYVNHKIRKEVRRFARDKLGMSLTEFNLLMFAVSMTGEIAGESRLVLDEGQVTFRGIFTRELWKVPADMADIILSYQGLPNASVARYLLDGNFRGLPVASGHSLGASDSANLLAWGATPSAELNALPFGRVAPPGSALRLNAFDPVSGGPFGAIHALFGHQIEWVSRVSGGPFANHSSCRAFARDCRQ